MWKKENQWWGGGVVKRGKREWNKTKKLKVTVKKMFVQRVGSVRKVLCENEWIKKRNDKMIDWLGPLCK